MGTSRAGGHQVAFLLRELVHEAVPRRLAAAKGLGSVGARQAWQDLAAVAGHDEAAGVRAAAMRSLGRLSAVDATGVLVAGLSDREPGAAAACHLGAFGTSSDVALLTPLLDDADERSASRPSSPWPGSHPHCRVRPSRSE